MDLLSLFGFAATWLMLLCYALEDRSPWFILGFAVACALSGLYAVPATGRRPLGVVVFTIVASRHGGGAREALPPSAPHAAGRARERST